MKLLEALLKARTANENRVRQMKDLVERSKGFKYAYPVAVKNLEMAEKRLASINNMIDRRQDGR